MIVAAIGIAINGFTAWLFMTGGDEDIFIRGAYLHMAFDAAVSLGVGVAGGVILLTVRLWLDPLVSLLTSGIIVWGTWSLLRESVDLALHAAPPGINPAKVCTYLQSLAGVSKIHDLHIWPMSTTETARTCHFVMLGNPPCDAFLNKTAHTLKERFKIAHATFQIERGDDMDCALAPDHVV